MTRGRERVRRGAIATRPRSLYSPAAHRTHLAHYHAPLGRHPRGEAGHRRCAAATANDNGHSAAPRRHTAHVGGRAAARGHCRGCPRAFAGSHPDGSVRGGGDVACGCGRAGGRRSPPAAELPSPASSGSPTANPATAS